MTNLWNHQREMVTFAVERPRSFLYAGMSTGKTLVALELARREPGRTLIIAPKAALSVYADDNTNLMNDKLNVIILNRGTSKSKQKVLDASPSDAVIVVNYETAKLLRWKSGTFTLAVADEAHRLGAYNSQQSLKLSTSCAFIPRKVAMTGTPYHDGYEKLYGIFRWLDPVTYKGTRRYPTSALFGSYQDFLREYCQTFELSRGVYAITGYKNVPQLTDKIKPYTLHVKTEDVIDLPELVTRTYVVPMPSKVKALYETLQSEGAVKVDDDLIFAPHVLTRLIRLQQLVTNGALVGDDGTKHVLSVKERLDVLKELLTEISGPVVVFTRFKDDVTLIREALNEPVSLLTGDVDTHEAWKRGANRVLLANVDAGSESVRLERAQHAVFWSVGWSLGSHDQSIARIRRHGQEASTVFVHYIVTEGSIDETLYATIKRKTEHRIKLDKELA